MRRKNKGIDYSELTEFDDRIAHCYSFGEIKDVFSDLFSRQSSYETMEQALDAAMNDAKAGEVILLCPATSSFDQFKIMKFAVKSSRIWFETKPL